MAHTDNRPVGTTVPAAGELTSRVPKAPGKPPAATKRMPKWIPLAGAMNHLVYWAYPITIWRTGTASQFRRCVASLVWMLMVYAAVRYAWPEIFAIGNFALAILIYLIAVELVNLPHHADQPSTS